MQLGFNRYEKNFDFLLDRYRNIPNLSTDTNKPPEPTENMIAPNYHNERVNFNVNETVKFVDDIGQIFTATIAGTKEDLLYLYFQDAENSHGYERPSDCFHA